MTTTVEAIYQNGTLRLAAALPLPNNTPVRVTIQTASPAGQDPERAAWLAQSQATLCETWDNADDEVFNALLAK